MKKVTLRAGDETTITVVGRNFAVTYKIMATTSGELCIQPTTDNDLHIATQEIGRNAYISYMAS